MKHHLAGSVDYSPAATRQEVKEFAALGASLFCKGDHQKVRITVYRLFWLLVSMFISPSRL